MFLKYTDKQLHMIGSYALVVTLFEFTSNYLNIDTAITISGIAVFVLGLVKEIIHDYKLDRGTLDEFDIIANIVGITLAMFVLIGANYEQTF